MSGNIEIDAKCAECPMRAKAEANPRSFAARLWKFHTLFCPGWKAYQRELKEKGLTEQPVAR